MLFAASAGLTAYGYSLNGWRARYEKERKREIVVQPGVTGLRVWF